MAPSAQKMGEKMSARDSNMKYSRISKGGFLKPLSQEFH